MNNRVIKFRAWHDNQMIKESFCEYLSGYGCMFDQFATPDAIMQFTGLHDKNGVEIYEGDVIAVIKDKFGAGKHEAWSVVYSEIECGFVAYNQLNSERRIGISMGNHFFDLDELTSSPYAVFEIIDEETPCEVLGNIYENPELLESEK